MRRLTTMGAPGGKVRELRICLAGSGGGHVRQLLDLEPAWSAHSHFFVSEDTALSRSISEQHRTHFVPHFAVGQAKLGAPFRMLSAAVRNFFTSARIALSERPNVLITTGAGAVFFMTLWARMLGSKVILIETFARFDHLSMFAKVVGRFAHQKIVQSPALLAYWPDAAVFDPMRELDQDPPPKKNLMFVTVGATLPFDRMVASVAELNKRGAIPETVFIQTGNGGLAPPGLDTAETLSFADMLGTLRDADIVVCHGGTGSLITALRAGCRVVAMPRLVEQGEHYDNHQAEITQAFAARGLIAVANTVEELAAALETVRARPPVLATSDPIELVEHLKGLLEREGLTISDARI